MLAFIQILDVCYLFISMINYYCCITGCGAGGSMRVCHAAGPVSIPGRDKLPG